MDNLQYIDERQVSKITGRALQTLRNDRHKGRGIPYVKWGSGRTVRYSLDDVQNFMQANRVATTDME